MNPQRRRVWKATALSAYLLAIAGVVALGLARAAAQPSDGWIALLVPAIFVPVIAYGRYYVDPEDQESFMRGLSRVLVWMMAAIAAGTLAFVVYLLVRNN